MRELHLGLNDGVQRHRKVVQRACSNESRLRSVKEEDQTSDKQLETRGIGDNTYGRRDRVFWLRVKENSVV